MPQQEMVKPAIKFGDGPRTFICTSEPQVRTGTVNGHDSRFSDDVKQAPSTAARCFFGGPYELGGGGRGS